MRFCKRMGRRGQQADIIRIRWGQQAARAYETEAQEAEDAFEAEVTEIFIKWLSNPPSMKLLKYKGRSNKDFKNYLAKFDTLKKKARKCLVEEYVDYRRHLNNLDIEGNTNYA